MGFEMTLLGVFWTREEGGVCGTSNWIRMVSSTMWLALERQQNSPEETFLPSFLDTFYWAWGRNGSRR